METNTTETSPGDGLSEGESDVLLQAAEKLIFDGLMSELAINTMIQSDVVSESNANARS